MLVQTIRFNYAQNELSKIKFSKLNNSEVNLAQIFNEKTNKILIYILPNCGYCDEKIDAIIQLYDPLNTQLIIVSVGIDDFDYNDYYNKKYKSKKLNFYIDKKNTFYRDFGLGFTEDFPTVLKYNLITNEFERH